jgi:hypothetical protein
MGRRIENMDKKNCIICGKEFYKTVNTSRKSWSLKRKFCSVSCAGKDSTRIKNHRLSLLQSYSSGKIKPWNKGIKTNVIPWNKGNGEYAKKLGFGLWMNGKKATPEQRLKMRASMLQRVASGNHNFYIDGRTPLNASLRHSAHYKIWRDEVFERDDYRCLWCGVKSGETGHRVILQADHILPWSKFSQYRFDVNNGQTLCYDCHKVKTDAQRKRSNQFIFQYQ